MVILGYFWLFLTHSEYIWLFLAFLRQKIIWPKFGRFFLWIWPQTLRKTWQPEFFTYNKEEKLRTRAPAAQRGRKSKFYSAHAHLHHLEVLHAKFHDRATSNLGD